jgi:hypothetical protein
MKRWIPRVSLREFLGLVLVLCIALAGVTTGSYVVAGALALGSAVIGLFMLMTAWFGRGYARRFATGFLIGAVGYWAMTNLVDPTLSAFHRWTNHGYGSDLDWGTSSLLNSFHGAIAKEEIYDQGSDEWFAQDSDRGKQLLAAAGGGFGGGGGGFGFGGIQTRSVPDLRTVTAIGKSIFFLMFGYIGGKCAVFFYDSREVATHESIAEES